MLMHQSNLYKEFATVDDARAGLIKYCYFDRQPDADYCKYLTIQELTNTNRDDVIQFFWWFFMTYIHIFYHVNRTKFNKLRAMFMRHVLAVFILLPTSKALVVETCRDYVTWYYRCGLHECFACCEESKKLDLIMQNAPECSG